MQNRGYHPVFTDITETAREVHCTPFGLNTKTGQSFFFRKRCKFQVKYYFHEVYIGNGHC